MSSPGAGSWWAFAPPASTSLILITVTSAIGMGLRNQDIINARNITAFVLMLLTIALLNAIDPAFASVMALLIFVAVFLAFGPDIMRYVGFNLESDS